ncbi:hypothetical protein PG985_009888 [Apiospora marii]|uniref:FAS1 domain-containing protein n=1 Tax=Apiospora marii TaxID=335849 RepID=A0ABR1RQI2_9PEZI
MTLPPGPHLSHSACSVTQQLPLTSNLLPSSVFCEQATISLVRVVIALHHFVFPILSYSPVVHRRLYYAGSLERLISEPLLDLHVTVVLPNYVNKTANTFASHVGPHQPHATTELCHTDALQQAVSTHFASPAKLTQSIKVTAPLNTAGSVHPDGHWNEVHVFADKSDCRATTYRNQGIFYFNARDVLSILSSTP